jgi:hypothetical protein
MFILRDKFLIEPFQGTFRDLFDPSFVRIVIRDFWKMEAGNISKKNIKICLKRVEFDADYEKKCQKIIRKLKAFAHSSVR